MALWWERAVVGPGRCLQAILPADSRLAPQWPLLPSPESWGCPLDSVAELLLKQVGRVALETAQEFPPQCCSCCAGLLWPSESRGRRSPSEAGTPVPPGLAGRLPLKSHPSRWGRGWWRLLGASGSVKALTQERLLPSEVL